MDNSFSLPTAVSIRRIERDNYRTVTLELDISIQAQAGQFVMVWIPGFDEKPFSLVDSDPVCLMVTRVGPFTGLVHQLGEGDRLWIRGPFGRGFGLEGSYERVALVGGGYGVAPLLWLARHEQLRFSDLHMIIGAGRQDDLLYSERFERLFAERGIGTLHLTTEDGSRGMSGRVTRPLSLLCESRNVDLIAGCGPHGMLEALHRLGKQYDVETQLSWEAYMRCAIGICGACEFKGHVLCLDGPVLQTLPVHYP